MGGWMEVKAILTTALNNHQLTTTNYSIPDLPDNLKN